MIHLCDITQAHAKARFDETVEVAINLGTNPKRGDQAVRGTALLPFGTGKSLRIAAFAEGEDAIAATAAGVLYPLAIMPAQTICGNHKQQLDRLLDLH